MCDRILNQGVNMYTEPVELPSSGKKKTNPRGKPCSTCPCVSTLDATIQSSLHRVYPMTRGSVRGPRPALIKVAHVCIWFPVRLGRRSFLISSPSGCLAAWSNKSSLLCASWVCSCVRQRWHRSYTDGKEHLRLLFFNLYYPVCCLCYGTLSSAGIHTFIAKTT